MTILYIGLVIYALAIILIVWDGFTDEVEKTDVAVVLGTKILSNGNPSPRLQARLDKAVELYNDGVFPMIIVSGGIGKEGFNEAAVMKEYLVDQGIPGKVILVDDLGIDTYSTAKNTIIIMDQHNFSSVLVISQFFHISRAKYSLKQFGLSPVHSAHADNFWFRDIYSTIREVIAFGFYLLRSY